MRMRVRFEAFSSCQEQVVFPRHRRVTNTFAGPKDLDIHLLLFWTDVNDEGMQFVLIHIQLPEDTYEVPSPRLTRT